MREPIQGITNVDGVGEKPSGIRVTPPGQQDPLTDSPHATPPGGHGGLGAVTGPTTPPD